VTLKDPNWVSLMVTNVVEGSQLSNIDGFLLSTNDGSKLFLKDPNCVPLMMPNLVKVIGLN